MKDSVFIPSTTSTNLKLTRLGIDKETDPLLPASVSFRGNKKPKQITKSALIHLRYVGVPLISPATGSPFGLICLEPDRPYIIGRRSTHQNCDFAFSDCRVSKQHSQILFDSDNRKIYIVDGVLLLHSHSVGCSCVVSEFRKRLLGDDRLEGKEEENLECSRVRVTDRVSMNGVFVNGVRIRRGMARELCTGDEVLFVCGECNSGVRIGFLIQGVVFKEEVVSGESEVHLEKPCLFGTSTSVGHSQGSVSSGSRNKRVFAARANEFMASEYDFLRLKSEGIVKRARFLMSHCREVLHSDDPISYFSRFSLTDFRMEITDAFKRKLNCNAHEALSNSSKISVLNGLEVNNAAPVFRQEVPCCQNTHIDRDVENNKDIGEINCLFLGNDNFHQKDFSKGCCGNDFDYNCKEDYNMGDSQMKSQENCCQPPGKKFYLNRLQFMDHNSFSHQHVVSLPELLHPIESIAQIFIATFTSDILWFLSYCEIPCHLPVTIACHNSERCWSSSTDKRISFPYSNFPNLVVVNPPFPEAIAFGNDRRRQGVACHHPKLIVLQRRDNLRVIITSANLVPSQWNNVTNTIWWQDFPRRSTPDFSSLFIRVLDGEISQDSRSDFAAQLAGFIASLVIDVPSQSHWIIELTKYNFDGAMGYLIASVPGIYSRVTPYACKHASESIDEKLLASVEASVVGLSHLFHTSADTNGTILKKLAAFLGKSRENAYNMSEVVLRRNTNVPADVNAVSVLVPNPELFSEADCVQLGFLPRYVAKWVSPLWDSGFFKFSGYIHPKEALAGASENNIRVQLILHVSQGPCFQDMMTAMLPEHVVALCSLIASIQRCVGLWRLEEVLNRYKWPEVEQSDFIYGSSSIGSSINTQFLSAFSAAGGKRSLQLLDSEESDPEWGCWTASQELRNPSIRIIFPTIERVKNACDGILHSKRILCFSEKTWRRLRSVDILHDAVPHPYDRVGHPMHVKVARRRFQSKTGASSSGWVYCGSHNFSAAAWGRPIFNPFGLKSNEPGKKTNSSSGLRLHVCNYELGIIFVFPPLESKSIASNKDDGTLDDVVLPFVVPAPKYGPTDMPATKRALKEAWAEINDQEERGKFVELANLEETTEEIPDEEEEYVEATGYVAEEKEEEKAYAEMLWRQVASSQSC